MNIMTTYYDGGPLKSLKTSELRQVCALPRESLMRGVERRVWTRAEGCRARGGRRGAGQSPPAAAPAARVAARRAGTRDCSRGL